MKLKKATRSGKKSSPIASKAVKQAESASLTETNSGGFCTYVCIGGTYQLDTFHVDPGYECPPTIPGNCTPGSTKTIAPVKLEEAAPLSLVAPAPLKNAGEYRYSKSEKALVLVRGNCGKGRVLKSKILIKDIKKVVPKLAEQILGMTKAKHVASFSVVLPAIKE